MLTKESYNKYKIIRDFDVEFNKGRGFTIFQSNEKSKLKKKFITPSPQEVISLIFLVQAKDPYKASALPAI